MKKRALIALALGAVVVIAVPLLVSSLDKLIAGVIESEGSEATGTRVKVHGIDLSLQDGRAGVENLTIASPDGFDPPHAFALGGISVDIDLGTVRDDVVVVDEIRVSDPVVTAQVLKDGTSNIKALHDHVMAYSQQFEQGGGGSGDRSGEEADMKRLRIRKFVFDGGRIALDASQLGLEPQTAVLPGFTLNDIGGAEGALPDEIAGAVLGTLTKKATEAVVAAGVKQKARDVIEEKAGEAVKGLLEKIGG